MGLRALARRIIHGVVLVLLSVTVIFVLVRLVPGDPALIMLPDHASKEAIAELRATLALDRPLALQYLYYLGSVLRGDLGQSFNQQRPALAVLREAIPTSLGLISIALAVGLALALPLGIVSATRPGSLLDRLSLPIVLLGQSMPTYWVGLLLIQCFAVRMQLLPTSGYGGIRYYILPSVTLAMWVLAILTRVTRARVQELMREPFVTVAQAKGLPFRVVIGKHVIRLAMVEISTATGVEFGYLLAGAVVTEAIFGIPGVGSVALQAIASRDYPVVQAIVLYTAVMLVALNFALDLLYRVLDPRIRIG
jgi:ABC-type dipeptide/oligopeptide/nickel transport system permease component